MSTFRKIVTAIVVVPLVVIIVAFAVANRQAVTVSFDPLSSAAPAYAATLPLFVLLFVVLILGVLVGGFAAWIGQGKWRRAARRFDADVRAGVSRLCGSAEKQVEPPCHATVGQNLRAQDFGSP
jgi:uncharacterized integral membrane protein